MVGDELFVAAEHPPEVADACLLAVTQRDRDRKPSGISEPLRRLRQLLELVRWEPGGTECLGFREIEAQQLASLWVCRHIRKLSRTFARAYERADRSGSSCDAEDVGDRRLESRGGEHDPLA